MPTIAYALGVEAPNPGAGSGRVLEEIFTNGPQTSPNRPRQMLQFNQQIKEYLQLTAQLRLLSLSDPRADNVLMVEQNAVASNILASENFEPFLGIEQIDRWHEAGSIEDLLERNEAALAYLRQQLARFKSNPFSTD
ncbi:MAG: hypothetical protein VKK42_26875 [Lyngbya sp.]|nr:hypothetical protein [Lyngbya sp.]